MNSPFVSRLRPSRLAQTFSLLLRRDVLAVLGYHRIGDRARTPYDPWLYSTDPNRFEDQIRYCKQIGRLIGLEEALAIAQGSERASGLAILLTFDDGYIDNYEAAFRVLKAHGVEAVFFLTSGFVEGTIFPWWDRVARTIRTARALRFSLTLPHGKLNCNLVKTPPERVIMQVQSFFKRSSVADPASFQRQLELACDAPPPSPAECRLFLSWEQAREMLAAGMRIGAHTHTHRNLARLSVAEQRDELTRSRAIIEAQLGAPVDTLAYPFGAPRDFTAETERVAAGSGYRAAFSFDTGLNYPGKTKRFELRRRPVFWGATTRGLFRP